MTFNLTYRFLQQLAPATPVTVGPDRLLGQLITVQVDATFESNNPFEAGLITDSGLQRLYDVLNYQTINHQLVASVPPELELTVRTDTTRWLTVSGRIMTVDPVTSGQFVNGQLPLFEVRATPSTAPVTPKTAKIMVTPGDDRLFSALNDDPVVPVELNLTPLLTSIRRVEAVRAGLFVHRDREFALELNNPLVTDLQRTELTLMVLLLTHSTNVHQLNAATFDAVAANDVYCLELQQRATH